MASAPERQTCGVDMKLVGQRDHSTVRIDTRRRKRLKEFNVALIAEGDPLPSVRTVATESRVNPLTVLKAYQQLEGEQLVEKKRGRGMFINAGARDVLLRGERQKFLSEQWPAIHATIRRLGLTPEDLLRPDNRPPKTRGRS